jgi:hypothetical protein
MDGRKGGKNLPRTYGENGMEEMGVCYDDEKLAGLTSLWRRVSG